MSISIYPDHEREIMLNTCQSFFFAQRDRNGNRLFEAVHNFGPEQRQFYVENAAIQSPHRVGIRMFHRRSRTMDFCLDLAFNNRCYGKAWDRLIDELDTDVFKHDDKGIIWLKNNPLIKHEDIANAELVTTHCRLLLGVMKRFYELAAELN